MIGFIDAVHSYEAHSGSNGFIVELKSGGESVRLLLTREAHNKLRALGQIAEAKAVIRDMEAAERVIPFPKKRRRRKP